MSKNQFTPGPLKLESGATAQQTLVKLSDELSDDPIFGDSDVTADLAEIVSLMDKADDVRAVLLDALENCLQVLENYGLKNTPAKDAARAAIAKAREAI